MFNVLADNYLSYHILSAVTTGPKLQVVRYPKKRFPLMVFVL